LLQVPWLWSLLCLDFVTSYLNAAFEDAPASVPLPMELRVMLLANLRPRADSVVWMWAGGHRSPGLEIDG